MSANSSSHLPAAAASLLPHRSPMLFVERLIVREGDRAVGEAVLPEGGIGLYDGRILPEYYIELIAQTTALANGFDLMLEGKEPHDGMLAGVDSFCFFQPGKMGERVRIEIEKTFTFGPVSVITGRVVAGSGPIAAGEIKVWEDVG